jgi:UDP-N-acetylmuramoyl-tripeptide--D-alanyl-D-alanine ligase
VGHIRYLCEIARPHTALVLNVGAAHLGEFGSREAIAKAKGELVEALDADGVAVLNADDELVDAMRDRTQGRVVTFGMSAGADVRIRDLTTDELVRPRFRLETAAGTVDVRLRLHGAHHAANAAAVTAAAMTDGIALDDIVAALQRAAARSPHRMDVRRRGDGLTVVDDAYNANPESTRAALDALSRLAAGGRRSWAVLGEMRELGTDADALHREIGAYAAARGIDELVVVGAAAPVADGARATADWHGHARVVDDAAAAAELVAAEAAEDDVVLVKASNSIALWRVADALLDGEPAEANA